MPGVNLDEVVFLKKLAYMCRLQAMIIWSSTTNMSSEDP